MAEDSTQAQFNTPPAPIARALIRSLARGTAITEGIRYLHVGHEKWLAAQYELLSEIAEDGHSDTKFVRGAYGAGKSHFLSVVQNWARDKGWVTSHIECKVDGVQIDRFETLYPRIVAKMRVNNPPGASLAKDQTTEVDPARLVLEQWTKRLMKAAHIPEQGLIRPFDGDARLYAQLSGDVMRSSLPLDYTRSLSAFARAHYAGDAETTSAICGWISGVNQRIRLPVGYVQRPSPGDRNSGTLELKPIGKGTARDAMRGLLWLVRNAGYAGLVLCIDEIEELAKLGSRRRQDQALQALREYVDHAGGEGGFRYLCMYLAATPEMFEGEDYFPRYDALSTRIQPVGSNVNWRGPVIDLDRTPLDESQMQQVAARICDVHRAAYGGSGLPNDISSRIVAAVSASRFRIAKPRLLARTIVSLLEQYRLEGPIKAEKEIGELIGGSASQIMKEISS